MSGAIQDPSKHATLYDGVGVESTDIICLFFMGSLACGSLHLYHVLAYPCSTMDIIHHVVSVGMVGSLSIYTNFAAPLNIQISSCQLRTVVTLARAAVFGVQAKIIPFPCT